MDVVYLLTHLDANLEEPGSDFPGCTSSLLYFFLLAGLFNELGAEEAASMLPYLHLTIELRCCVF